MYHARNRMFGNHCGADPVFRAVFPGHPPAGLSDQGGPPYSRGHNSQFRAK
jgi:hypothetical protein